MLFISKTSRPLNPAFTVGAVTCTERPTRAKELFPSMRAARWSGSVMNSSVCPMVNRPCGIS